VRQERIDRGELAGTSTRETAQLRGARQRIAELESELAIVKRASALFDEAKVVRPKELFDIVETLALEGHGTKRVCRLLRIARSGLVAWRSRCRCEISSEPVALCRYSGRSRGHGALP